MLDKTIIAANWKMKLSIAESIELAVNIKNQKCEIENREIILFPSFLALPAIAKHLKGSNIGLGGQNIYFESKGAYTGEISPLQLKEVGCTHVLIGHSERRHYFQENYETINKKVKCALDCGLKVMLCVGESLEERENKITEMVVVDQIVSAFSEVRENQLKNIYITYEPIWAIGTGKTATPKDATHVDKIIRKTLKKLFKDDALANDIRLLYGGSVKKDNIQSFLSTSEINGVLIGKASLESDKFLSLVNYKC